MSVLPSSDFVSNKLTDWELRQRVPLSSTLSSFWERVIAVVMARERWRAPRFCPRQAPSRTPKPKSQPETTT